MYLLLKKGVFTVNSVMRSLIKISVLSVKRTHTQRQRQTDRQRQRQADKQRQRQTETETDRDSVFQQKMTHNG